MSGLITPPSLTTLHMYEHVYSRTYSYARFHVTKETLLGSEVTWSESSRSGNGGE